MYDVFLSKLFSGRDKDRDDLRVLKPQIEKGVLISKLAETSQDFLKTPDLKKFAMENWQILFGEPLPS